MGIRIELSRQVVTEKYHLVMELGRLHDQRHIIAFLQRANEDRLKKITPKTISEDFLRDLPESVGKRMIQRCVDLGLLEWIENKTAGKLTTLGEEAIKEEKIFLFERDTYEVIYTDDTLLPALIYYYPVKKLEIQACKDNAGKKSEPKQPSSQPVVGHVPDKVKDSLCCNRKFFPIGENKEPIIIKKVEEIGSRINCKSNLKLSLILNENGTSSRSLTGDYQHQLNSDLRLGNVFPELLKHPGMNTWDTKQKRLRVKFSSLNNDYNREHFVDDITLTNVKVTTLGIFEEVKISNIPVMPLGMDDAQKWSEWLLEKSIDGFVTPNDYNLRIQRIEKQLKELIPTFSMRKIDQRKLAMRIKTNSKGSLPKRYWLLKAPLDLAVGVASHVE